MSNRRYHKSSSFKMALLFTILLGCSSALLGYFVYRFSQQSFIRETEAAIDADLRGLREREAIKGIDSIRETLQWRQADAGGQHYLLLDNTGKKLAGTLESYPHTVTRLAEGLIEFPWHEGDKERLFAAKIHTFADGSRLLVARDILALKATHEQFIWSSALMFVFMALVVGVSFYISTFVVGRINIIAATAQDIMDTGDLSRRILIHSQWDDLSNLAQVLNSLLARVEVLMAGVRQVSDNIAHDLRTPLTRLRNRIEDTLAEPDVANNPSATNALHGLMEEADHLLATFAALLRIATLEQGKQTTEFTDVAMHIVLGDVLELYEPLAEKKAITLQAELLSATLRGDRNLLFQLAANLLDNAIKFSPEGGAISVRCSMQGEQAQLEISDNGIGLAAADKEEIFTRFWRADASRHLPGNGLGLSLVAAVVALHGGTIHLHDNHPGLTVKVVF